MRVARWGNSLALRLPARVVRELALVEGDEVEIRVATSRSVEIARDEQREKALETMRQLRRRSAPLPPDYRFDREEAHERGSRDLPNDR
ncbi:MAG: AbrB/MazE/SpoVT family DNA-binding domain-containing protein [Geminicoccaceae bacterium]|jgi:antitoxin MazE|nr:AbrB/MazE/SpoVT family DNA-binding domain-containing protein [Geminicoccaceae bacterium]MCB9966278.1 AbrB/MazE/SpoVT family DNA-binding domain-containing protein [Geminicoccaceae bacterium]HRY23343.1 AbrB/MazE/SpoVT family DNA-binding domain-containing protein [Geminicoccaceae bacterium]